MNGVHDWQIEKGARAFIIRDARRGQGLGSGHDNSSVNCYSKNVESANFFVSINRAKKGTKKRGARRGQESGNTIKVWSENITLMKGADV